MFWSRKNLSWSRELILRLSQVQLQDISGGLPLGKHLAIPGKQRRPGARASVSLGELSRGKSGWRFFRDAVRLIARATRSCELAPPFL